VNDGTEASHFIQFNVSAEQNPFLSKADFLAATKESAGICIASREKGL
jgi:hypothetical protein